MAVFRRWWFALVLCSLGTPGFAQAPEAQAPLPELQIEELGELLLEGEDFSYRPWSSENGPGKVHVIQLFNGTMGDSKIFEPFTDRLQEVFERGTYHVTTIINLDAALWGTSGFVISQVKKNKRRYPLSTLVLDKEGVGARQWQLGKKGAGLVIVDRQGVVQYVTRQKMTEEQIQAGVDMVGREIDRTM